MRPAARIVLDEPIPPEVSWCWRDTWSDQLDSSYGLFSKFAFLNAIGVKELVDLFIRRDLGVKTAIQKDPCVDLRSVGSFDVARMSKELRMPVGTVLSSFVLKKFPNAETKALTDLKWCEKCMCQGLHLPVHQLDFIGACPLHGVALTRGCPKCKSQIPYRLSRDVFRNPFACPKCGYELALPIKRQGERNLQLSANQIRRVEEIDRILADEDSVLTLAFEFDRRSRVAGRSRFAVGRADLLSSHSDYAGFVTAIMEHLRLVRSPQIALSLEGIAVVRRGIPVTLLDVGQELKRRRGRSSVGPSADPLQWTARLDRLQRVYGAVRRHLWRKVIGSHRRCVVAACRSMWWDVNGERTAHFCKVAMAFIRWRMCWEGLVAPSDLLCENKRRPNGLVAWSQASVSIMRYNWSDEGAHWVMQHAFALSLFARFFQCFDDATTACARGEVIWERLDFSEGVGRHWAISGNDSLRFPLLFFKEAMSDPDLRRIDSESDLVTAHFKWHVEQLARIRR